ncbi:uncharacterized protein SOCG_02106 [Schizosaccharomyces octosporus yFS286]|uniref:Uncharacterized protein n=1 Tax=Schizosaccharomyces octosporus (strain yFS286) TaxID=483514 RepID=S9Q4T1_SCHOY|nr:uncharacterized protein SOCG_02106 [Schizosaccharomyces octosporus yFS286]EPX74623.1 hypothetical protein SOCG_02106 [Schizosaccharomyces octosporus yFS286]
MNKVNSYSSISENCNELRRLDCERKRPSTKMVNGLEQQQAINGSMEATNDLDRERSSRIHLQQPARQEGGNETKILKE